MWTRLSQTPLASRALPRTSWWTRLWCAHHMHTLLDAPRYPCADDRPQWGCCKCGQRL